jgi:hypothetical protein
VGEVGTAATRAGYNFTGEKRVRQRRTLAVDSGYFATMADVGLVGLVVLLAIFARATVLARAAALRGYREGWLALGIIVVLMLDALTRSSFTGFPTAYIGMFVLGISLAAAKERRTLEHS